MHSQLQELVDGARHLVAFTGAGVSTLSGLQDFRGKNGLYNNPETMKVFEIDVFRRDPSVYYKGCRELLYGDHDLSSSLIHHTLARWEAEGKLEAIITQNIDLLHQKAGSKVVHEVHGSPKIHRCLLCDETFAYAIIQARVQAGDIPPRCSCGGIIKPDITFFGEELPAGAFHLAKRAAEKADLLLVLGTSLTVYPAASLPVRCLEAGGRVVIVNDQPTDLDHRAVLVLRDLEAAFR